MKKTTVATVSSVLMLGCLVMSGGCQADRSQPTPQPIGAVAPSSSTKPVDSNAPAMIHFDQNNRN